MNLILTSERTTHTISLMGSTTSYSPDPREPTSTICLLYSLGDTLRSQMRRQTALKEMETLLVELPILVDTVLIEGPRDTKALRSMGYVGVIEAPRGILVHDFHADDDGRIAEVNLIVATQNNYDAIDSAVSSLARHFLPENDDEQLLNGVEFAMRCFDPCLACATHAAGRMPMTVELRRGDELVRTIRRGAAS